MPRSLWDRVQAQLNNNLRKRWNRVRERASSLLTGLVENEHGNRYTPSFTVRRGRRYRYYVSQLAIKNTASEAVGPTRVPAQELENRVTDKLLAFLKADAEVFDGLDLAGERPEVAEPTPHRGETTCPASAVYVLAGASGTARFCSLADRPSREQDRDQNPQHVTPSTFGRRRQDHFR